ncbi:MAG TPA: DUF2079 domain-containing protein [Candidatus Baltobacteraceae bacterium]|nr:DUF2079 domain-containing protein [Candidatus Baltobacteraceae bacterium]
MTASAPAREFADALLWTATAAYAAILFGLGYVRYAAHRNFVDLGIFAQTAASAFGCFCNTVEGSHWAVHFSPVLYAAGALLAVWPSALALVALGALAGSLTIPPVYALVRRYADRRTARLAALIVFLYPPLAGAIFNDFHENSLAPAAVAWLAWAFDGGYALATAVFAAAVLAVKEDQAVFLSIAGALGFLRYRGSRPRGPLAAALALVSLAVLLGFFLEIQPAAAHHAHWMPSRFYAWTAADSAALFPAGIAQRAGFLLLAFAPLLFLPMRTRAGWLLAAPLAEVLLSRDSTTFTIGSHYAGAWCGYAFVALAYAVRRIYADSEQRAVRMLAACAVLCVLEFAVADPLHPGALLRPPSARDARLEKAIALLPRAASIATQEEAYTHLAATDPNAAILPETPNGRIDACFVLTDEEYAQSPRLVESAPLLQNLIRNGTYRIADRSGSITLYKKKNCR